MDDSPNSNADWPARRTGARLPWCVRENGPQQV